MQEAVQAARISKNLDAVKRRIERAALRVGRDPAAISLLAVTKYVGLPEIQALATLGVRDIGESRVPDLVERASAGPPGLRWHLIGHLQRNKVRKLLPLVSVIHSVDSLDLGETIARIAREEGTDRVPLPVPVLLQVNVSGEASRFGLFEGDLPDVLKSLRVHPELDVRGLMTLLPYEAAPPELKVWFRKVRELADRHGLRERSMGMSHDFELAVEEGATMVRIGSSLFTDGAAGQGRPGDSLPGSATGLGQ